MKEKNRVRNVQLHFMVSPEERKQIEENMKLLSTENLGAYLRKMALDGYLIHLDLSEVREMIRLLRNATNNLNQIARYVNLNKSIDQIVLKHVISIDNDLDVLLSKTK